jgi:hypothetical protein
VVAADGHAVLLSVKPRVETAGTALPRVLVYVPAAALVRETAAM